MQRPTHLIVALERILEISYSGHPDGRELRLELITRYANEALKAEDQLKFVTSVMSQLNISDSQDIGLMAGSAVDLFKEGFSIEDAVELLQNTEHVNPDLPEDIALANMAKIRERHKLKMNSIKEGQ